MLAETQRREMLATMGVDVFVLRAAAATDSAAGDIRVAVLCGQDDARHPYATVLRKTLPLVLSCPFERIDWIEFAGLDGIKFPPTRVCLILGADIAVAAKAHDASMPGNDVLVAVADAPRLSLGDALARRALWQALKPIARYLHLSQT